MAEEQRGKAQGKQWEVLENIKGRLPTDLPRSTAVACFRLLTGHDYLQKHLHRIGIKDNSICVLCGVLGACPRTHTKKNSILYWAARRRMAVVAIDREGVG
uniref:Uncharacterized protein n=1 Tax=Rhodnius prolixus TaxID=13249 RepID=T1I828_RHOPR